MCGENKGKTYKGVGIGLLLAVLVIVAIYTSKKHTSIPILKDMLPGIEPKTNATEVVPHPKDVKSKTTQAEIDNLLKSVNSFKDKLPPNIYSTINNLVADHPLKQKPPPSG